MQKNTYGEEIGKQESVTAEDLGNMNATDFDGWLDTLLDTSDDSLAKGDEIVKKARLQSASPSNGTSQYNRTEADTIKKLIENGSIPIHGGFCYFAQHSSLWGGGSLCRARIDGTGKESILSEHEGKFYWNGFENVYQADPDMIIYEGISLHTVDISGDCIVLVGESIYYLSCSMKLMKCGLGGEGVQEVYSVPNSLAGYFTSGLSLKNGKLVFAVKREVSAFSKMIKRDKSSYKYAHFEYDLKTKQVGVVDSNSV